jgi:copper chaperone CopZ
MKSISKTWMVFFLMLSITTSFAQTKNAKTETIKIYGNCDMCKATIEKAAFTDKIAKVEWNKDTKMAVFTFDETKTNSQEILKKIALAGYDSDSFLAPDAAYAKLPGCCRYERTAKIMPKEMAVETQNVVENTASHSGHPYPMESTLILATSTPTLDNHAGHTMPMEVKKEAPVVAKETPKTEKKVVTEAKKETDQMQTVFNAYFKVKDAMVNTDTKATTAKAIELVAALAAVKMNELSTEVHVVWMKVMKELTADAKKIAASKKMDEQRKALIPLTKNIYALIKVAKAETSIYYQFCPMANGGKGANWLSKENEVRNPYYGSEMMSCGKVVETIK